MLQAATDSKERIFSMNINVWWRGGWITKASSKSFADKVREEER